MNKIIFFNLNSLIKIKGKDLIKILAKEFKIEDFPVFKRKFEEIYYTKSWNSKNEAFKELCSKVFLSNNEETINKITNISNKNLITINLDPKIIKLLQNLKKQNFKIGILSNVSIFTINLLKQETKLLNYIDYPLYSYDLNVLKPDIKAFESMVKLSDEISKNIIFVSNNRKRDIIPAKKLGFKTIYFKDIDELEKKMVILNDKKE